MPITALVDDGSIPKNNKVPEVSAMARPAINKMMLIFLFLSTLLSS